MSEPSDHWPDYVVGLTLFMVTSIGVSRFTRSLVKRSQKNIHIEDFRRDGVVVIPNVLSPAEVQEIRKSFHDFLATRGCDVDNLPDTADALSSMSSTGGAGGILDVFYEPWKLRVNEHPKVVDWLVSLLGASYSKCVAPFNHPYGVFNAQQKGLQRSLTPHLDCCPHRMHESDKKTPKWRPIQAFIALTDTLHPNEGGFEAHPGFHMQFDEWSRKRPPSEGYGGLPTPPPCVGEFTPIRPQEDKEIIAGMKHIPCRAGDLVCWDYRIPHANARRNDSSTPREVIYIGVLPGIDINRRYAEEQLKSFREGIVPTDQWHESTDRQPCMHEFTALGRRMMTIDSY